MKLIARNANVIEVIDSKFIIRRHSFLLNDADFDLIEKYALQNQIYI